MYWMWTPNSYFGDKCRIAVAGLDPLLCWLLVHACTFCRYVLSTTYAINTSVQTTTKCQPFLLMFYRTPLGATALNTQCGNDDTESDTMASGVTAEDVHNNLKANIAKVSTGNLQVAISTCIHRPLSCTTRCLVQEHSVTFITNYWWKL